MLVSAARDFSRVMMLDNGAAASRIDGVWVPGLKFSFDEMNEDFMAVEDSATIEKLATEARTALASSLVRSNAAS